MAKRIKCAIGYSEYLKLCEWADRIGAKLELGKGVKVEVSKITANSH
ncbi:MAG: hypothetical protein PHI12_08415 [Dehalococcoidales bacterium]|nr:hypothetical protein [Dehalococcoidales bacterium]